MGNTATRVIKNTGWLYAKMGITMFISLWTTRLILNGLGASDFGIFNIVGGVIAMLGFLNAAMASASLRFMSYAEGEGNKEKQKTIFNISLILHIAIAVIVSFILVIAGFIFFNGILNIPSGREHAAYVVYGSLIVSTLLTIVNVPYDAVMNAHENMKYYAYVGILESFLKLSVAFACVYATTDKLILYGILMACIPLITLSIMKVYCHRNYEECIISPKKYFDKSLSKEMASFAGWNLMGTGAGMVCNYGQNIVVNYFFGVIVNAAMGIVNQITGQVMVLTNNMLKAVNPVIVKRAGAGNQQEMLNWSYASCRYSYLLLVWIALPICFESDYILKIWLKNVPEWTVIFVQLQMIRTLLEQITNSLGTTLSATGKIKKLNIQTTYLMIIALVAICIAFHFGAPPYILFIIMIIEVIVQSILKVQLCHNYGNLSYKDFLSKVCYPIIALTVSMSIPAFFATSLIEGGFLRLLFTIAVMWICMFVCIYFIYLRKDEKEFVFGKINCFINKRL